MTTNAQILKTLRAHRQPAFDALDAIEPYPYPSVTRVTLSPGHYDAGIRLLQRYFGFTREELNPTSAKYVNVQFRLKFGNAPAVRDEQQKTPYRIFTT